MNKLYYILIFWTVVQCNSCISPSTVSLSSDNLFQVDETFEPQKTDTLEDNRLVESLKGSTTLFDFAKDNLNGFVASSSTRLSKSQNCMKISAENVGEHYERFTYYFDKPVDFSNYTVLKLTARAEANNIPGLRIDLKDDKDAVTNKQDSKVRVIPCGEFANYYFNFTHRFKQGWPTEVDVDRKAITALEFFVNPGGPSFTGEIFIEKIVVMNEDEFLSDESTGGCQVSVGTNSNSEFNSFWSNSPKYVITQKSNGLTAQLHGVGAGYESFSKGFTPHDLSNEKIVKVRAKYNGKAPIQLRVDVVDRNGIASNGEAIISKLPNDDAYHDLYYDFHEKFYQGWPSATSVDKNHITELMFFVNPGGTPTNGRFVIEEIELLKSTNKNNLLTSRFIEKTIKSRSKVLDWSDSKEYVWGNRSDLSIETDKVVIRPKESQKTVFGAGTNIINLKNRAVLSAEIETEDSNCRLRLKLHDSDGMFTTELEGEQIDNQIRFDFSSYFEDQESVLHGFEPSKVTGLVFSTEGCRELSVGNINSDSN